MPWPMQLIRGSIYLGLWLQGPRAHDVEGKNDSKEQQSSISNLKKEAERAHQEWLEALEPQASPSDTSPPTETHH